MTGPVTGQAFPREARIRKRTEFDEVYQKGARFDTPFFVLYIRRGNGLNHRLGMTVSKRIGDSVTRNRVKRRFREIFRKNRPPAGPPFDMVLNARKAAGTAVGNALEAEFLTALARARASEQP